MNNNLSYTEKNHVNDLDLDIEGVVILSDYDTFSDIKNSRVMIFNDTAGGNAAIKEFTKTKNLDIVFDAARSGHVDEISIEKLVLFYLENSM